MSIYKFAPGIEPLTFIFPTDNGWLYSVSFKADLRLFQGHALLENDHLTFEIDFDRSPLENASDQMDDGVGATILQIIANQFQSTGILPIYFFLCDTTDSKEAARARLFTRWYESSNIENWTLFNYELQASEENVSSYFVGLFIHTQHPHYQEIPNAFERFLHVDASIGKLINRR